jgi:NADPH:quinone reductase-like Zn-dependent oxidoreductase
MRAAIIRQHGDLDAIRVETLDDPTPGPGEALIEVRACALNHMDLWARKGIPGFSFPLPLVPGCDIAGIVRVAPGWDPGTEVVIQPGVSCGTCARCLEGSDNLCAEYGILGETQDGGCAELVVVPTDNLLPKPPNISFAEAAAYPLTMLTAWHMLVTRAGVKKGDTVLVHAAGSGVGSAAIQIAALHGATVFATAGTPEKCEQALKLGASEAINYRHDTQWSKTVFSLNERRGVDIVIEHVGQATFDGSLRALAPGGRMVTCGATTGANVTLPLNRLFFKNLSIIGSTMGTKDELKAITRHVAQGELRATVDRVLPLDAVKEAHRALEAREAFGKIVITP